MAKVCRASTHMKSSERISEARVLLCSELCGWIVYGSYCFAMPKMCRRIVDGSYGFVVPHSCAGVSLTVAIV